MDNPLLKRRPRKPTEAEVLAWRELSRDRLPDPRPYARIVNRSGRPGLEIGLKGTF